MNMGTITVSDFWRRPQIVFFSFMRVAKLPVVRQVVNISRKSKRKTSNVIQIFARSSFFFCSFYFLILVARWVHYYFVVSFPLLFFPWGRKIPIFNWIGLFLKIVKVKPSGNLVFLINNFSSSFFNRTNSANPNPLLSVTKQKPILAVGKPVR